MMFDNDVDPDAVLRPNQKHVDAKEFTALPTPTETRDRNGNPTGEFRYHVQSATVTVTLKGLDQLRALEKRRATEQFQNEISLLRTQLEHAKKEALRLQNELESKTTEVRRLAREQDETRLERRVQEAVAAASERDQSTIQELRGQVLTMTSEIAELREAKRRLKAARQGR